MSRYLVDRIAAQPNIEVVTQANITALEGRDGMLEAIRWRDKSGAGDAAPDRPSVPADRCGAEHEMARGFGRRDSTRRVSSSPARIQETARGRSRRAAPGVYAIGDVRLNSVKRVGAAIGEGAQVVAALHAYLAAH